MINVHHLNCTTFRLRFARTFDGQRSLWDSHLTCVTHCLVVETSQAGLVLVDTGFSLKDVEHPGRVSPIFHFVFRPPWKPEETALAGIRALGLNPQDVRHIVLTHLDYDHAAGLADFPWATAHVDERELEAVRSGHSLQDRLRYDRPRLNQHAHWKSYADSGGDNWYELQAVHPIEALGDDFALAPLPGHSPGHCGVLVRGPQGWLLHAGDAYMQRAELQPAPLGPARTGVFQPVMQADGQARKASLACLAELDQHRKAEVRIFCAHDQSEFEDLKKINGDKGHASIL